MKKWKSILLAVLAVGSLASCDSGEPITREAAVAKLAAASQEMVKGNGLEVKAKASAELELSVADGISQAIMTSINAKVGGNAEAAVFFTEQGELTAAKALASLNLDASSVMAGQDPLKSTTEVSAEAYLKDASLYAKEQVKTTETGVEPTDDTTYYVSTVEALTTMVTTEINDLISSFGGTEGINESLAMLEGLGEAFPDLKLSVSGKKETISWSINDKGLNAVLKGVFVKMSEEQLRGSIGEEAFNKLPPEALAELETAADEMVATFDPIIDLNTLSFSVSILEGNMISDVKFELDLAVNNLPITLPSSDEATPGQTLLISARVKTNDSLSIKKLAVESEIEYPEDLDTWASKVEPEQPAA